MKSKWLGFVLVVLCVCAALSLSVLADAHDHVADGDIPLTSDVSSLATGRYYLASDLTISRALTVTGSGTEVELCLNGYMLTVTGGIQVTNGAILNITDCYSSETHENVDGGFTHTYNSAATLLAVTVDGGVITTNRAATVLKVTTGATLNLQGGTIAGGSSSAGNAGGVYVEGGTLNFYGGTIRDNAVKGTSAGGGIGASLKNPNIGIVNIYGGEIMNNTAAKGAGAIYTMDGKSLKQNGIYVPTGPEINIYGGSIHGNSQIASGAFAGGIYIGKYVKLNITGGRIYDNCSAGNSGGVCLVGSAGDVKLSGSAYIGGNYSASTVTSVGVVTAYGTECNLYISCEISSVGSPTIAKAYIAGPLAEGASIGVTYGSPIAAPTSIIYPSDYDITMSDLTRLHSDREDLSLLLNINGSVMLCQGRSHYQCGTVCTHAEEHESEIFEPLEDDFTGGVLTEGSYYLTKNITLTEPILIRSEVNLCLEGYAIASSSGCAIEISDGGELNLSDCYTPEGVVPTKYTHEYVTQANGPVTTYGGTIYGMFPAEAGGVVVKGAGSRFNMFNGTIGGANLHSGVSVTDGASFQMYGGRISACFTKNLGGGVYVDEQSSLVIHSGNIDHNVASQGGGVYAVNGFALSGDVNITDNNNLISRRNNVYLLTGVKLHVSGLINGTVGIRMQENDIFTTGGAKGCVRAFRADAESGTYVDVAGDELVVTAYGVNIQPTTEQPTVIMKGFENVRSYQWYSVTLPGDDAVYSVSAGDAIALRRGDTLRIIPADAGLKAIQLAVEVEVTLESGETITVLDPKAVSSDGTDDAFYLTAPADGTYYLIDTAEAYVVGSYTLYGCQAAVDNQTAATFTGRAGWYICRAEYIDGVTVVYSQPFFCENHKHAACGMDCTHDDAHNNNVSFIPVANTFDGGLMAGEGELPLTAEEGGADMYTLPSGSYYLAYDVVLTHPVRIDGSVTLCLYGHSLNVTGGSALYVAENASLIVCTCDAQAASVLSGTGAGNGGAVCTDGSSVELYDVTLRSCGASGVGGCIYAGAGSVVLEHCALAYGAAAQGGCLYVSGGAVTMTDCTISDCTASQTGGAVYLENGTVTMTDCTLNACAAAQQGGGLYVADGTMTMTGCSVNGCTALQQGGGLYVAGGTVAMRSSAITGSAATQGAGLYLTGGTVMLQDDSASGCNAQRAVVYFADGSLTLKGDIQMHENTGGGLYLASGKQVTLADFAETSLVGVSAADYGPFAPEGTGDYLDCFYADLNGEFVTVEEEALSMMYFDILEQPTGPDRTIVVNSPERASYQWYQTEVTHIDGTEATSVELEAGQMLVLAPTGGVEEDATAALTLLADGSALETTLRQDKKFVFYITGSGEYQLPDLGEITYRATIYTLGEELSSQVTKTICASAGGYLCKVTYVDGTVLWSDLVVIDAVPLVPGYSHEYEDVSYSDPYYNAVMQISENGWMVGVSETEFAPQAAASRAMVVTVLWRMDGMEIDEASDSSAQTLFADVSGDDYFCIPVDWASRKEIVCGVSETEFAPDDTVTLEQVVVMLYRYAEYKQGYKPSFTADLSCYTDAPSDWAVEAIQWAVGRGLLHADAEGRLLCQELLTRAQVACLFMANLVG